MHNYALYIGRFQPFHKGHLASVKFALSIADKLIIVLGGYQLAPSLTDPWPASARKNMILSALTKSEKKRIQFIFIRDRLYNEDLWKENVFTEVQIAINNTLSPNKIAIIGHDKDDTSYYLKIFPQWQFIETGNFFNINGTQFRKQYFSNSKTTTYRDIPTSVANILKTFRKTGLFKTLQKEYNVLQKIPKQSTSPMTPFIFLLVGNYLLLNKRSHFPGKNLYSLPYLNSVFSDSQNLDGHNTENPNGLTLDIKYFVTKQNFYTAKYDGSHKQGKVVSFYHLPNLLIDVKKYSTNGNNWILFDDFCLIENEVFADHYQIIRSLMFSNRKP